MSYGNAGKGKTECVAMGRGRLKGVSYGFVGRGKMGKVKLWYCWKREAETTCTRTRQIMVLMEEERYDELRKYQKRSESMMSNTGKN